MTNLKSTIIDGRVVLEQMEGIAGADAFMPIKVKGTREQFLLGIMDVEDLYFEGNQVCFNEQSYDNPMCKSTKVLTSENRMFRMFCHEKEKAFTIARDENGRAVRVEDNKAYIAREVNSAREFVVVNLKYKKSKEGDNSFIIKMALLNGIKVIRKDGSSFIYRRVAGSASQTRLSKRVFTSLDIPTVREAIGFGATFPMIDVNMAKIEARYGQALSSTIVLNENYSFDIIPDYEITRTHDVVMYDEKKRDTYVVKGFEGAFKPADGQGTILPSAAVRASYELGRISYKQRDFLLAWLEVYSEDFQTACRENEEFRKLWKKIPTAFQIRLGFAKGLLVVYNHSKETTDCNGQSFRADNSKCNKFFGEKKHEYDFSKDIMFTDSMWKENFNPKYLPENAKKHGIKPMFQARLEIVLWQKPRNVERVFMGYQYWQALGNINIKKFAGERIDELKETIYTDANHAKEFLGLYATANDTADDYNDKLNRSAGRIQRVMELLNENPEMIHERYVQETIRETRRKYIQKMEQGRIDFEGANPYIVTAPEVMFGHESILNAGEYSFNYNGKIRTGKAAAFRSPLIDESEAVVLDLVPVMDYEYMYDGLLIMNPYDDTLPRMGGADTDGDKVALIFDEEIIAHVQTGLPMLYDDGSMGSAKLVPNDRKHLWIYDVSTIINSVKTIGEVTNLGTSWKDIGANPDMLEELGLTIHDIKKRNQILRFLQGSTIDFAKTGTLIKYPEYVETMMSPQWKPWTEKSKDGVVYESKSQLGQLFNAVNKYMEKKFDKEKTADTRDFTFEVTHGADFAEVERIKPIVAELETAYRHELRNLHDMELSEEEEAEYLTYVMDKYELAVRSIDSDIRSIAAAAYQWTYFESQAKSRRVSFVWNTCYDGLLLNVSSASENRTKLLLAEFDGHLEDIPSELKFARCESKGVNYTVSARVPNGTFKTFKKHGRLYLVVPTRSITKDVEKKVFMPTNTHLSIAISGFTHYNTTAEKALELLKEANGVITIRKTMDHETGKELRAGVYVGDTRIGTVARRHKFLLAPWLLDGAVEVEITNLNQLKATYVSKKDSKVTATKTFETSTIVLRTIEIEMPEFKERTQIDYDTYVPSDYDTDYTMPEGYEYSYSEENLADLEINDDIEMTPSLFDDSILEMMRDKNQLAASYWNNVYNIEDMNITNVVVEQLQSIKQSLIDNSPVACVILTSKKGTQRIVYVKAIKGGFFEIDDDRKIPQSFQELILQVAHYELFANVVVRKQA